METRTATLTFEEIEFLEQSNLIEGVTDADSFQQAAFAWEFLKTTEKLTIGTILKTHKILMNHQKIRPDERGYFRQRNVSIGYWKIIGVDGDKLIKHFVKTGDPQDHKLIRQEMESLIGFMDSYPAQWRPHHIKFEHIHPFIDGNGRVGRMVMNWQRLKAGLPILVIKDADKKAYYEWFKQI